MRVFITGGTGLTGPAVVAELIAAGHSVTGLARSDAGAARLEGLGATAVRGSLDDLGLLRAGAEQADGVVHMAFGGDFSDPADRSRRDVAAIGALGQPLTGTGKPLVITSGTLAMTPGRVAAETDAPDPAAPGGLRIPGEQACLALAGRGVRASVVRLAPTVHGPHDVGFIPMLIATAREKGVSAYVGDGANRWPAVHRLDAAVLFRLTLEQAPAGTAVHGAAEGAIPFRAIAEKIGQHLDLPVASVTPEVASGHFASPFMALVYAADNPVSSDQTRSRLGWEPAAATLLGDLDDGDYFDQPGAA